MLDKQNPLFWKQIKTGSTVTLTDEQSIKDSMDRGEGVRGRDYLVDTILKINADNRIAEWIVMHLDDDEQDIFLVVKIVDQVFDIYVYFQPDEVETGDRRDIIDRGDNWIFAEPDDVENFKFNELEFSFEIFLNDEKEDADGNFEDFEILYKMKKQGVLYGTCFNEPSQSGLSRMFATIVEYHSDNETDNPELLITEIGGAESEHGGLITILLGCSVNLAEVDVLSSQEEKPVTPRKKSFWEKVVNKLGS